MCVVTAYGVQCLVPGCRGSGAEQQAVSAGRGMLHVVQHPSPDDGHRSARNLLTLS